MSEDSVPPLGIQILSMIILVCCGLFCIVKGVSYGLFNWWYILGGCCLVGSIFATFRIYEVCVMMAERENAEGQLHIPGP